jgi:anaerobic ribonucleoside-triphosphate reductase activating protein
MEIGFIDTPGISLNLWAQGCSRGCKGCQNPELQSFEGGQSVRVLDLTEEIKKRTELVDWVCFTGGDFLFQPFQLAELAWEAHKLGLKTCLYTGEVFENIPIAIKNGLDRIIDGPYMETLSTGSFPASSNQRIWQKNEKGERVLHDEG